MRGCAALHNPHQVIRLKKRDMNLCGGTDIYDIDNVWKKAHNPCNMMPPPLRLLCVVLCPIV